MIRILVFAKQVPDVNKISFDSATGRIIRDNVPLSINSFDKKAVEEGIRIKEKLGAEVTVATMGPPQASEILNESLRMGADRAFLITDKQFGGADTWVTSKILSRLVEMEKPNLVLCGKYSLDGETSQVPPEIAYFSEYSLVTSVSSITFQKDQKLTVEQESELGNTIISITMPAVISVSEKINKARKIPEGTPDMHEKIISLDAKAMGIDINGQNDSLTIVAGTEKLENKRKTKIISVEEAIKIIEELSKEGKKSADDIPIVNLDSSHSTKIVLGIAIDSSDISGEIASELANISTVQGFEVVMAGNISPDKLKGIPCHRYINIKSESNDILSLEISKLISEIKPEFVILPSTVNGREISATIAAELGLGLTADCINIKYEEGKLVQFKPAFGGGIIAKIVSKTKPEMATVRSGILKRTRSDIPFTVSVIDPLVESRVEIHGFTPLDAEFRSLSCSNVIFGIGMGARTQESIKKAKNISYSLGGTVAGTRPVVDMKLLPRQQQVGLTGASISPLLYVAVGISGNDNHIVGLRYAKTIIAVNKDESAPIFSYSDYSVIMDSESFLSTLSDKFVLTDDRIK
ncbi:protein containing Electron transfer flavoprotein, alpha/beta-subunit [mine drainage metagenome]|uniref:Protein containing Electron transfer flavoprotein, alpha/beta-subunit n=1 Tax=mine drainage metagenome TaxID=410659 RepID=T1C5D0_9ZZZZ